MTASSSNKKRELYEHEYEAALQRIKENAPPFGENDYFFRIVHDSFSVDKMLHSHPSVAVLGTSIPEEIIYAAGTAPHWILGGSSGMAAWADDMVPRDTDPVSRSMLGYLQNDILTADDKTLIVVPLVNDSSRKIAYLLQSDGKKVHTVEFSPVKDRYSAARWNRQMEKLAAAVSAHTKTKITSRSLQRASQAVLRCRLQMQRFIRLAESRSLLLSDLYRMFIINSYYCTEDPEEWSSHLERLNSKLQRKSIGLIKSSKPGNVLLMGSPIYFPNYKIPFLSQDAGLHICANLDYTTQKVYAAQERRSSMDFQKALRAFFKSDCSSAYSRNDALYHSASRLIAEGSIEGVVYHVLKGQIEYDFELERLEELFAHYDVPVCRLETDYNYQDIEQLRIRVEAFAEVISQKRYSKEVFAV